MHYQERLYQLKTGHIEEGLSLEQEIERDSERHGDDQQSIEEKVTIYNISQDGVNTSYSQSTSKKV